MNRLFVGALVILLVCGCGSPQEITATTATTQSTRSAASSRAPVTEGDYIKDGIQHLQDADVVDAIKSFDLAIKEDPLDPQPYLVLSQTYMRIKQYDRAIDTLEAAQRVAPNRGDIQYLLAINYGITGQDDMAKKSAQRSIELFRQDQDEENFMRSVALLQGMLKSGNP